MLFFKTKGRSYYGQLTTETGAFFGTLATNNLFRPRYSLVLMVVPESTLGGLSGKHNFEGNQGGM